MTYHPDASPPVLGAPTADADPHLPTPLEYVDGRRYDPFRRTLLTKCARFDTGAVLEVVLAESTRYSTLELVLCKPGKRPIVTALRGSEVPDLRRALDLFDEHARARLVSEPKRNPNYRPGAPRGRVAP